MSEAPGRDRMEDDLRELRQIVDDQANNPDLWFVAEHVTEAYLQASLRQLHDLIERATRWVDSEP